MSQVQLPYVVCVPPWCLSQW